MANMSYCRFNNTWLALKDCIQAMEDGYNFEDMDLSKDEFQNMKAMYSLCTDFISEFERLNEMSGKLKLDLAEEFY